MTLGPTVRGRHRGAGSARPRGRGIVRRALAAAALTLLHAGLAGDGGTAGAQGLVDAWLAEMGPAERVGQIVIADFDGAAVDDGTAIARLIDEGRIGGVVLDLTRGNFADTADAPAQIAALVDAMQARAAAADGAYAPLLVALAPDAEGTLGGALSGGVTDRPTQMALAATWDPDHARRVGEVIGRELAAAGVNLLLGPSLDVATGPVAGAAWDPGPRTFGGSPSWVARFGAGFVEGVHLGSNGRVAVAPGSFPGVGSVDRSPTDAVAVVERTTEELLAAELVPFLAVAGDREDPARADAVVTTPVRFRGLQQQDERPFALDTEGLRYVSAQVPALAAWQESGGLVISPELGAPSLRRYIDPDLASFSQRRVLGEALSAGNDLLVATRMGPPDAPSSGAEELLGALAWLAERYEGDAAVRSAVDRAARRVLELKVRLYDGRPAEAVTVGPERAVEAAGLGGPAVAAVAAEALTVLAPPPGSNRQRPDTPTSGDRLLLVVDARARRPCPACDERLEPDPESWRQALLRDYGPAGIGRIGDDDIAALTFDDLKAWLQGIGLVDPEQTPVLVDALTGERQAEVGRLVREADWLVFATRDVRPATAPGSDALDLFLAAAPPDVAGRLVVVALGAPHYLDTTEVAKLSSFMAVYAPARPFLEVAGRALFGDAPATGASPVSVPGVAYDLGRQLEAAVGQEVTLETVGLAAEAPIDEGRSLTVRTSLVRDGNGRPVPDGTDVTFQRLYADEGVFLPDVSAETRDGTATVTLRAEREGRLVVTALFGNGLRSRALELTIGGGVLPRDVLDLPDVALGNALVRRHVPVDWGIFLLSLTLILLVGVLFHGVDSQERGPEHQVRPFLLSTAWGLAGYLLVAAGGIRLGSLPGGVPLWPAGWSASYQAPLLGFLLALVPVLPVLARATRDAVRRLRRT